MLPKWHILIGAVATYILIYFFNFFLLAGLTIFLASILIDLDHYLRYSLLKKKTNIKDFWNWSMKQTKKYHSMSKKQKKQYTLPIFIFHSIEFWAIIIFLSFVNEFFLWILIGIAIHMIADTISLIIENDPLDMKFSIIYNYIISKNKKTFD